MIEACFNFFAWGWWITLTTSEYTYILVTEVPLSMLKVIKALSYELLGAGMSLCCGSCLRCVLFVCAACMFICASHVQICVNPALPRPRYSSVAVSRLPPIASMLSVGNTAKYHNYDIWLHIGWIHIFQRHNPDWRNWMSANHLTIFEWQNLYLYRHTQVIIKYRLGNIGMHSDRSLLYSCDLIQV